MLFIFIKRLFVFQEKYYNFYFWFFNKVIFYFVIPLFLVFLPQIKNIFKNITNEKKTYSVILLIISLSLVKNFFNSGCLLYPITSTCFDRNIVDWSSGKKFTSKVESHLKANSKGYNTYTKLNDNQKLLSQEEYLKEYRLNYFKFWIKDKDFERLLLIIFIYLLILTVNLLSSKKINMKN